MRTTQKPMRKQAPRFALFLLRVAEFFIALSMLYGLAPILMFRLEPIGAVYFALILAGFAFASLLYNRSRAYTKGRARFRSLVAAETAMQGVFNLLISALLGASMYATFLSMGFVRLDRMEDLTLRHIWLLVFLVPMFMTVPGLVSLRRAIEIAAIDLVGFYTRRRVIARRVWDGGIRGGRRGAD
ncbi:hypothetical protein [Variovorax sp. YR750]|uniref:hypothetical protein n=1 Tax=Variovorax sp. YR750 TaxID=1884384 RepID=UPI000B88B0B0|nr:hypothetical protein [Variovorax sp. YR750]